MRYSKGIMWLDDCRIPTSESLGRDFKIDSDNMGTAIYALGDGRKTLPTNKLLGTYHDNTKGLGRFTPNLLVCDDMLNDGSFSKSDGRKIYPNEDTNITNNIVLGKGYIRVSSDIKDKGTNSRYYDLDKWFDNILEKL